MQPTEVQSHGLNQNEIDGKEKAKRQGAGVQNFILEYFSRPTEEQLTYCSLKDKNWRNIIDEATTYLLVDQLDLNAGFETIQNISFLLQQVVQAMAAVKTSAEDTDDHADDVGRKFIVNMLGLIFEKGLFDFDPTKEETQKAADGQPEIHGKQELLQTIGELYDELIKNAGLDEEHVLAKDSPIPNVLKALLYPKGKLGWASYFQSFGTSYFGLSNEAFKQMFVDTIYELCLVQHRLKVMSQDEILEQHAGAAQLAEDLAAKHILQPLRNKEDFPFDLFFIRNEETKEFLESEIKKVLLQEQDLNTLEGTIIQEAWNGIESQLSQALKAILAIILKPTQEGESPEERRKAIFEGILSRLSENGCLPANECSQIDQLDERDLYSRLKALVKDYNLLKVERDAAQLELNKLRHKLSNRPDIQPLYKQKQAELESYKMGVANLEIPRRTALELLARTTKSKDGLKIKSWNKEANAFCAKVWGQKTKLSHQELIEKLESCQKEQSTNPYWKLEWTTQAKALLAREALTWKEEAQKALKQQQFQSLACLALGPEINANKFEGLFPEILSMEGMFANIYHALGTVLLEIHEHDQFLQKKGAEANEFIAASHIQKLPELVDNLLIETIHSLEKQAGKQAGEEGALDLTNYAFLNEIAKDLIKNSASEPNGSISENVKAKAIATIKNIIPIVLTETVKKNTVNGKTSEEAFVALLGGLVEGAKAGLQPIFELMPKFAQLDIGSKVDTVTSLANFLKIKNFKAEESAEESADKLDSQYLHLLTALLARDLTKRLLPKKLFNTLLPPMLRDAGLWETLADHVIAPYIEDLYKLQEPIQRRTHGSHEIVAKLNDEAAPLKASHMQALDLETKFSKKPIPSPEAINQRIIDKLGLTLSNRQERVLLARNDLGVFIDEFIIGGIKNALKGIGKQTKDAPELTKEQKAQQNFLDRLLNKILNSTEDANLREFRESLIKDAVYMVLNEILLPAQRDANGVQHSATERSAQNIRKILSEILAKWQAANGDSKAIAKEIIDVLLPEQTWKEILSGNLEDRDLALRRQLIDIIETYLNELNQSAINIQTLEKQARLDIQKLDRLAVLNAGVLGPINTGGLEQMAETICQSIDATLDEYAEMEGKFFDQPLFLNAIAKEAFKDPNLSPVIKGAVHALVNICLARLFTPKHGKTQQGRILEVFANLMHSYDAGDANKTAQAWLEEALPENLRKQVLPAFLHDVLTHKFLADVLVGQYAAQVQKVSRDLRKYPAGMDDANQNISRLQKFAKDTVIGLDGMGDGFVKVLAGTLFGSLAGKIGNDNGLGTMLEQYLSSSVAKIASGPHVANMLNQQFLSEALIASLPMLGQVNPADLPDYPRLKRRQLEDISPAALKKLGIDLVKEEGENDDEFKKRVNARYFELEAGKKISELLFPNGPADLPVPEVAQLSIWNNLNLVLADQVKRLTRRDDRIMMAIGFFGVNQADQKDYDALTHQLQTKGSLAGAEKSCEKIFENSLTSYVMKTIEDNVAANWPQPFKALAVYFVKTIAWIALKIAINRQLWTFVSSPITDQKLRRLLWKLLSFSKTYQPAQDGSELSNHLGNSFSKALENTGLLSGLQGVVGPALAGFFSDANLVDLMAPVKA